jgi:HEPN domain-containing protein
MVLPNAPEARPYNQAAKQRFDDAQFLLNGQRNTAAIYLAGYCVECIMKALILSTLPKTKRLAMVASFRGGKAHDFDWLRSQYAENGGPRLPTAINTAFSFVNTWAVDIRYMARTAKHSDAARFVKSAKQIMKWADERM